MADASIPSGNGPAINGSAYRIVDHTYDVVVVGAGGAGLRATRLIEQKIGRAHV